jgi:hypothetical protein
MTNDRLFYSLGRCLASGHDPDAERAVRLEIDRDELDWHRFVWMASSHLVLPSVYLRFRERGVLPLLPPDLRDHLESVYRLNLQRNSSILRQVERLNRLFAANHISPIYLKGVGNLLDHVYPDVGERMSGDIDILVSDDEFIRAADVMQASGYEARSEYWEDQRQITKHYPRLIHPTEPADVEIHRVPVPIALSRHFSYSTVAPDKIRVEGDCPCYVLSDRHKVILNFMHGFMAYEARILGRASYRNMIDLSLLARRVDVFEVLQQLPRYRRQAGVYADFVNHALCLDRARALAPRSRLFASRHALYSRSRAVGRLASVVTYLGHRLWTSYVKTLIGACVDRRVRTSVFRRLATPGWYVNHLRSYTSRPWV